MRQIDILLNEYAQSHQNKINKLIHNVAVPAIYFVSLGLLYSIPQFELMLKYNVTFAHVAIIPTLYYYFKLSGPIGAAMTLMSMLGLYLIGILESQHISVWKFSLVLFVVMWILQFIGHHIEGKKPSFFKDLQFLLIGPAWLMHFIFKKVGISY